MGTTPRGIYLASLSEGLPRNEQFITDQAALEFRLDREGKCHVRTQAEQIRQVEKAKQARGRRRSVGRPRFGREALSVPVPFRVTPTQKAALVAEAERLGVAESDVIRMALDCYFDTSKGSRDSGSTTRPR